MKKLTFKCNNIRIKYDSVKRTIIKKLKFK